jgi:hypothetical protein
MSSTATALRMPAAPSNNVHKARNTPARNAIAVLREKLSLVMPRETVCVTGSIAVAAAGSVRRTIPDSGAFAPPLAATTGLRE